MNKHILIIRLSSFGDVAMTVPIVSALRLNYPKLKITILVPEPFAPLFNQIPQIDFLYFKQTNKSFLGLLRLSRKIIKIKPDFIIDLHNVLRTKFLVFFLKSLKKNKLKHSKLNKGRKEKKELIKGIKREQLKSMHQRYADVFSQININLDLKEFKFYQKLNIKPKKYDFYSEKKLLGIAPFAKHKCKEYSIKNILKLIDLISQEINILIFGDQNNTTKIKSIIKGKSNVFDASSGFTLEEEMEIISNLDLMISMDSANGHIASLFGIKVLTIWGATHPFTGYGPFKQPEKNSITPNLRKYPNLPVTIYGSACPEKYLDVINTIKPEKIAKRINEII